MLRILHSPNLLARLTMTTTAPACRPLHHSVSLAAAQESLPRARSSSAGPRIEPYRPSLLPVSCESTTCCRLATVGPKYGLS